jgi:hypothetical protein
MRPPISVSGEVADMGLTTKVNDVAAALIGHLGPIDTFKLQKLLY